MFCIVNFNGYVLSSQFLLLGAVPFPKDVPRLKKLGVGGVITLNEPYETLVPSSLYYVSPAFFFICLFSYIFLYSELQKLFCSLNWNWILLSDSIEESWLFLFWIAWGLWMNFFLCQTCSFPIRLVTLKIFFNHESSTSWLTIECSAAPWNRSLKDPNKRLLFCS